MNSLVLRLLDQDGSAIRGMFTSDGMQVFSVYDFMTIACGYTNTGATARKEFQRLTSDDSEHKDAVVAACYYLQFPGSGQRKTPCMTIRGLQRLLMILGGKVASEFRKLIEGTFTRVMARDQGLIEVINANAASDAPMQQAYRAALAHEPVIAATMLDASDEDALELPYKKRRRALALEREEVESRLTIDAMKSSNMLREYAYESAIKAKDLVHSSEMKAKDAEHKLELSEERLRIAEEKVQELKFEISRHVHSSAIEANEAKLKFELSEERRRIAEENVQELKFEISRHVHSSAIEANEAKLKFELSEVRRRFAEEKVQEISRHDNSDSETEGPPE